MLYLESTSNISTEALTTLLQHHIQGKVTIQHTDSIYTFHCQPTSHYFQLRSYIQEHHGFSLLVEGHVLVLQLLTSAL